MPRDIKMSRRVLWVGIATVQIKSLGAKLLDFGPKTCTNHFVSAKSKRGRREGDGTENVINCRDVCRKLS